ALARNCPANSSTTITPGSFARSTRATRVAAGTPTSPRTSPDTKSPTPAGRLGAENGPMRRDRSQARMSATAEPAVPGATGERPDPKPLARIAENGCRRNAAPGPSANVDIPFCAGDDPRVLIGLPTGDYNRANARNFDLLHER